MSTTDKPFGEEKKDGRSKPRAKRKTISIWGKVATAGKPFARQVDLKKHLDGMHRKLPIVDVHIRLSRVIGAELSSPAPDYVTRELGLPPDATFSRCIARAMAMNACAGDVAAAKFCYEATEAAKTLHLHVDARAAAALQQLKNYIELPALEAGEGGNDDRKNDE